jgi:hypothetical protein
MSLSGIEASRDLRAPLAAPCGFRLAVIAVGLARVEEGDHGEHAAVIVLRLG